MPHLSKFDFGAFAEYETAETPEKSKETGETRTVAELVHDSTAAQLDYLVEAGELTAEQVYAAETEGKARKGVLTKYAPEEDDADKAEPDADPSTV